MAYSREQGDINATDARGRYWKRNLSPAARAVFEADHRYFLHQSLSTPVLNVLSRAEGIHIYDMDGKAYIDMHGNGVHNAGFNNDAVIEAVVAALREKNTFAPRRYTNAHAVAPAKKLVKITPEGLDRVLFAPGGSEAIEMAVMLAKQVTGKWKTISFWDSYHGNGFQAASVGGERLFKTGNGRMVPGALHVEFPNYYRNPWGFATEEQVDDEILRQMELLFERDGDIACGMRALSARRPRGRQGAAYRHRAGEGRQREGEGRRGSRGRHVQGDGARRRVQDHRRQRDHAASVPAHYRGRDARGARDHRALHPRSLGRPRLRITAQML
ncbi:Aminotransferase class-III [Paenibacillus sp. UNC496MF]|uniref:aminotransferase class III-fold pyridoxal phosphate-dependent enzyme n=1 Tax=Paenibacillus sp. UNC496MF TaxID=1502753 RepID=UPI0008E5D9BB|nr:aminotransferase class III-fold pyridoxal phosphate-dependent enzyme [Paenibacillus sp. UNC496MF]SFI80803.1 Aminotransferase class-III [Paenibacillus sp. UNC496MF]